MADKDTLNLIKFKFGSFQSIKDLSSKEQSSFYFADDKPAFYNAGLWYGVSSLTSSVNEETGEVTLTINGGLGEDWKSSQTECKFVAGMTTEQKDNLKMVVDFVNSITTTEGEDTQTVIDKWNEIINFLEGFKDTDVLVDRIVILETNVTNLQNTTINGGDGLKGGGNLLGNRTIVMGTPSTITDSTINEAKGTTHTHAIDEASTEQRGIVRLNDSLTSESTDQALTANQGKVLDDKVKSVADLLNDMFEKVTDNGKTYIKTKYGFASDEFVSAGGTDDTESGGSGGANLTQIWESLQGNNDTFKDRLINVAHIPTLTTGKISDFVSATQAIANTAVANKADKATTLAGYGITDAVTLNTEQTITGVKTFSNLRVNNSTLVTNLNAEMVGGLHASDFWNSKAGNLNVADIDVFTTRTSGTYRVQHEGHSSALFVFRDENYIRSSLSSLELYATHFDISKGLKVRTSIDNNRYSDWKTVAFTDTNSLTPSGETLTINGKLTVGGNLIKFKTPSMFIRANESQIYFETNSGTALVIENMAVRPSLETGTLGTLAKKWQRIYTKAINIGNASITWNDENQCLRVNSARGIDTNSLTPSGETLTINGNLITNKVTSKSLVSFIGNDNTERIALQNNSSNDLLIGGGYTDRTVYLDANIFRSRANTTVLGGKVGIGTDSPTARLHVNGDSIINGKLTVATGALKIVAANLSYDLGTLIVDKSLKAIGTMSATQGEFANYIKIGNATISWNPKGYLVIDEGLASHKFISAGGVVTGDAGGGGGGLSLTDMWVSLNGNIDAYGKSKIHIDHIPLDAILSHDDYENDVADRINTFNYRNSSSFTSAVKALIVAGNIPTLEMSKIEGLETTLTNIGTVVQNNYDNLNESISTLQKGTIADHEARIKAIEQALTWQTV